MIITHEMQEAVLERRFQAYREAITQEGGTQ